MSLMRSVVITAVVSALAGGASVAAWYWKLHPEELAPKYPMKVLSTGTELLTPCKAFTKTRHPTRMIEVIIPGTFDPRNLQPVMRQYPVTKAPWTAPDPVPSQPFVNVVTWTPKTRLDMNLDLVDQPTGNKAEMVLIRMVVDDQTVHFRNDNFAVTAGDNNGKSMFCQITNGYGQHDVTFVAYYFKNPKPPRGTFGSFNMGLIVPDATDPSFTLPIFVDPDVENNGFL